ncbi:MAG: anaerobic ribonucleoside-triphosphate reductase activating protein [Lachnospiraceae bacterium]|nr:anaerobic ribonucleoside-triphosphate reductase activating protein [Lachnospiraceae bacterium]
MKIYGLNKTTLLDYPEHVAATVFTGGCNFCCPFCHNKELVLCPEGQPLITETEIFDFLKKRKGIITGVCITGGEPTLQPDLKEFLTKVKEIGLKVKLDTNGYRPEIVKEILEHGLADYVAMDIKSCQAGYREAAGREDIDMSRIEESVSYLMEGKVEYEFRTTIVKEFHTEEIVEEIGKWICGCRAYYLQSYEENENVICKGFHACTKEELAVYKRIMSSYVKNVGLRGVQM